MPAALQPLLEEHVRKCVNLLRALECKQRPSSATSLMSWIKHRSCRKLELPLHGEPIALATAMLPLLHDTPALKQAMLPLTNCQMPTAAGNTDGDSPDTPEPVAKRPRTDLVNAQEGLATAAARAAQKLKAEQLRAARTARAGKDTFLTSSLSARLRWLKSQTQYHSVVEPRKLVDEMVSRGIISKSDSGRIIYNEAAISDTPRHQKPCPVVADVADILEQPPIEIALGSGNILAMRLEAVNQAGLPKLASEWRQAALRSSEANTESVERLKLKILKGVGIGLTVRMAAPQNVASEFCRQLRQVAETSVLKEYSPVQVEIFPVNSRFPRNKRLLKEFENMVPCRMEVEQIVEAEGWFGQADVVMDSPAILENPTGKGRGKRASRSRMRGQDPPTSPENLRLLVTFPRNVEATEQTSTCEILRIIASVSPAFTCKLPREVQDELLARMTRGLKMDVEVDTTVSFWPSFFMLQQCHHKLTAYQSPQDIFQSEGLDAMLFAQATDGKGKSKGEGKEKGKDARPTAVELLHAFKQSIEKARVEAPRKAVKRARGKKRQRFGYDRSDDSSAGFGGYGGYGGHGGYGGYGGFGGYGGYGGYGSKSRSRSASHSKSRSRRRNPAYNAVNNEVAPDKGPHEAVPSSGSSADMSTTRGCLPDQSAAFLAASSASVAMNTESGALPSQQPASLHY